MGQACRKIDRRLCLFSGEDRRSIPGRIGRPCKEFSERTGTDEHLLDLVRTVRVDFVEQSASQPHLSARRAWHAEELTLQLVHRKLSGFAQSVYALCVFV